MDFSLTPEEREFQAEVRAFIKEHFRPEFMMREGLADTPGRREFVGLLAKRGWLRLGWPKEYGGIPSTPMMRVILNEELAYAGAPNLGISVLAVGQGILHYGTEELKKEFLEGILNNEILFAYAYTEPHAGSDLANLKTRAHLEGDEWVINGEKMFISPAHYAHYFWLAVRTDPSAPKHKGISLLIAPIKSKGVTISDLETLGRRGRFGDIWRTNRVIFDNVRIPARYIVGKVNQGWQVISAALDDERLYPHTPLRRSVENLVKWANEPDESGYRPAEDPQVREVIARLTAKMEAAQVLFYIQASSMLAGKRSPAEAAMTKIAISELDAEIMSEALKLFGARGLIESGTPETILGGEFTRDFRASILGPIAAGTSEILRNHIARHGLGLPRTA